MKTTTLALLGCLAPFAAHASRQLTVDDAVQLALQQNGHVAAARAQADAAEDSAKSVRGHLLPSVHFSDEQQHWDSPFTINFGGAGLTARNINTNLLSVSAGQPLLGLLHLTQDYAATNSAADAARAGAKTTEAAIEEAVRSGFLRYFQATAAQDIARASEKELNDQLEVMKSRLEAGVLTRADVLRTQVAVANAQQAEIQAQVQARIARQSLLALIGVAVNDEGVTFAEPTQLEDVPQALPTEDAAIQEAIQKRPELVRAQKEADAAAQQARAKLFQLLPEINLEAAYIHNVGQVLQPKEQEFIGLKADWNVWEWGAEWYAHRSAAAQATAADREAEETRRQVALDVTSKLALAQAAKNAVQVAKATIASAEEAFRVTKALVDAGSATTTDLLDAESALTQARLNLVRARYDEAIARVSLTRAMG
jgi:outer membrane protein TolC